MEPSIISKINDLCCSINDIKCSNLAINEKQCYVVSLLADTIIHHVEWWIRIFSGDTTRNSETKVGKELSRVLESGLKLIKSCDERFSPTIVFTILSGKGQFSEIIEDSREYVVMLNRLTIRNYSNDPVKHQCAINLWDRVRSDWESLQAALTLAYEEDKKKLIMSLRCQSDGGHLFRTKFPVSSLLPLLLSGLELDTGMEEPNIKDTDLSRMKSLGEGSFGSVKSAVWNELNVAVKEFYFPRDFKDELKVYKMLLQAGSPHIVQMLGHTTEERLVLELMDKDLNGLIMGEQWLPSLLHKLYHAWIIPRYQCHLVQSVDMMFQIAKAMRDLHSINVIHRDLKSKNVLVKTRKNGALMKVADFGISKGTFNSLLIHTGMRGTFIYMAPEMRRGEGRYGRKVDVYSFGLLSIEILTRKILTIEMTEMVRNNRMREVLPNNIPINLESLISSCTEEDDKKRPSFENICDTLFQVKEDVLLRDDISLKIRMSLLHLYEKLREFLYVILCWIHRILHWIWQH